MNNLALIISYLFPNASPISDYTCQDNSDGNGPFIAFWNETKLGPQPTQEQLLAAESDALFEVGKKEYINAMQRLFDDTASSYGYDDIKSAIGYIGDPYPVFHEQGIAFRNWRSDSWQYAISTLAAVKAGTRTQPTQEEFLAELPKFTDYYVMP